MMDIEDIRLFLLMDENQHANHWQNVWLMGYPLSQSVVLCQHTPIEERISQIQVGFEQCGDAVMIVAHGFACNAWVEWLFHSGADLQKRISGVILAEPDLNAWSDDDNAPINRARANFPVAWVMPNQTHINYPKSKNHAQRLGAKHLIFPKYHTLNAPLNGWQWGMSLMQDILL